MSWLRKIISTIRSDRAEPVVEEGMGVGVLLTTQCLTTESSLAIEPAAEDENPSGQRRYFVKRGLFYDPADKVAQSRSAEAVEEIPDKRPLDLKTLFPKLSLR